MRAMARLKAMYMSEDGSRVDYSGMADSDEFLDFSDIVGLLRGVQPEYFSQDKVDVRGPSYPAFYLL